MPSACNTVSFSDVFKLVMLVYLKALNQKVLQYTFSVRIMLMPTYPVIPQSVLQNNDYPHKAIPP